MAYTEAKWIYPKEIFSWWYVDNVEDTFLADKFSPYLRNARLDWTSIATRPWHNLFAELTTWDYPKWISSYYRSNPNNNVILVRHNQDTNKKLVTITSTWTITAISTSTNITSNNRMNFVNTWDVIYCMNWSDLYWKLSWTTYTLPTTWVSNLAPSFWIIFNSSMWVSWWSTNSNIVYKSVADDFDDFNSSWADTFTFDEQITWLATNSQALFYFTKNTISVTWVWDIEETSWSITYFTRKLQVKEWAVNHNSIVSVWVNLFFLTPSNKIARIRRWMDIDWFEIEDISERKYQWIDNLMNTLDKDQTDSFGYYLPKENLIKWHLKSKNATFNDVCIVYDVTKDAFLVDTQKFFYWWTFFDWLNYTISMIEPKVYLDEYANDDEDTAIQFTYYTKRFDLSSPTWKKELWETRTYLAINDLAELTQEIYIDWNLIDTKIINKNNIPISSWWIWTYPIWTEPIWNWWYNWWDEMYYVTVLRTKWNLQKKGKYIQIVYKNNSLAGRCKLINLWMKIEQLPSEATNLTD